MASSTDRGSFVPTTNIFDVSYIQGLSVNSREFKEILVKIRDSISLISTVLNKKTTGIHDLNEFVSGSTYFADPTLNSTTPTQPALRQEFIKTINFGALPDTATKSVAHGIVFPTGTNTFRFVHIRATASDLTGVKYIAVPNADILVDATNVSITTAADMTAYTDCIVVLKFIKS